MSLNIKKAKVIKSNVSLVHPWALSRRKNPCWTRGTILSVSPCSSRMLLASHSDHADTMTNPTWEIHFRTRGRSMESMELRRTPNEIKMSDGHGERASLEA